MSTTQLMRNQLKQFMPEVNDAHAGLLMQRGLSHWDEKNESQSEQKSAGQNAKSELISKIGNVSANNLYLLAFERWLNATYEGGNAAFATLTAKLEGRLYTGLPLGGTLETGASVHHTYGMPMLSGSAVKGAVRAYTEQLFAARDSEGRLQFTKADNLNKFIIQADKKTIIDTLFGKDSDDANDSDAGYLVWHDAWWIPMVNEQGKLCTGEQYKPFAAEIVTVHHQKYYSGEANEALEMENPVPNQQIAIQGAFYFVIEGEEKWATFAKQLLQQAIENMGLGAKTSSGYGYFTLDDALNSSIAKRYAKGMPIDVKADPLAPIRHVIKYMDDAQLIEVLSKGRNKLFEQLGLDRNEVQDVQRVVQVVMEEHGALVGTWAQQKAKNTQKAYKFVTQYLSS